MRAARHDVHLGDQVDVGERAATEPDEACRIEALLQVLQPIGDAWRSLRMVVMLSSSPSATIEAIWLNRHDQHFFPLPDRNAFEIRRPRGRLVGVDRGADVCRLLGDDLRVLDRVPARG